MSIRKARCCVLAAAKLCALGLFRFVHWVGQHTNQSGPIPQTVAHKPAGVSPAATRGVGGEEQ